MEPALPSSSEIEAAQHKINPNQAKIRIGYLSSDYFNHATAQLIVETIERHDRRRFEVLGYSYGPTEPDTPLGRRIISAFDQFTKVDQLSDADAAKLIRADKIDILVDMKGHTQGARMGILAYRPAPIQAHYLGFPATTGVDFLDYYIADPVVAPLSKQSEFSEQLALLPGCYQPNDLQRPHPERQLSRQEFGLPDRAVVFCCFSNCYKMTPHIFSAWMSILQQVDGGVLWLLADNEQIQRNLWKEAEARGVSPERILFAGRTATTIPMKIARTAALLASSGFFSPTRRATVAVAAALKPMASEYTKVMTDSV